MISLIFSYLVKYEKVGFRGGRSHTIHHDCNDSVFYFLLVIVLVLICIF